MSWSADIAAGFGDLLAEVGEDVQWTDSFDVLHRNADQSFPQALFKRPGQLVLSDMQISDEYAIEYRGADFVGLARGDRLQILGATYRVKDVLDGDDPVLKVARLAQLLS